MNPSCRRLYTGRVITLDLEEVVLPNGHRAELEVVGHPGGAAIVAVNGAGEVCLLRQYRHVAGGWLWEIPAGKLDGRGPDLVARAELQEEAGQCARRWESLGRMISSPGVFAEVVHLFLARELTATVATPEADEVLEVHWLPLAEAAGRAERGEIEDAKSAIALMRAARRLGVQT
jgi:ADP-ribose pyrophosphatase